MASPVSLIVLAAGLSTRMGERDKLGLPLEGGTVLERAVAAAVDASVGDVLVVTGPRDYRSILADYPVRIVHNPEYEEGMGSSIRAGVRVARSSAVGIVLGDMPFIRPDTIRGLAAHVDTAAIVLPQFDGTPGHPVLFASRLRGELLALTGDVGARSIVDAHADEVIRVETDDPGILRDIDTEEAYREHN